MNEKDPTPPVTPTIIKVPVTPNLSDLDVSKYRMDIVNKAIDDSTLPKFYSNGFTFAAGNSDLVLTFQRNNKPEVVFNLSMTIAKTLGKKLTEFFEDFESKSPNKIMTTDEIEKILVKKINE